VSKLKNRYCWVILIVIFLLMFSLNFLQFQMSPFAKDLMSDLSLSDSQYSSIFTAAMFPAIFISIICGIIVDKFGIKVPITIGLIIAGIGTILMNIVPSFFALFCCFFMVGVGITFINANVVKIFDRWFLPTQIALAMGIFAAAGKLSQTFGMMAGQIFPTRQSALLFSTGFVIVTIVFWLIFGKENNPMREDAGKEKPKPVPIGKALATIMKSKNVWILSAGMLLVNGVNVATASLLQTAIVDRGGTPGKASLVGTFFALGGLTGSLLMPAMFGRLKNRKILFAVVGVITCACIVFGWKIEVTALAAAMMFIAGFLISGCLPMLMSMPIQLPEITSEIAGTTGGFCATLQLIGGVALPTYIITPIAHGNYDMFFWMVGGFSILFTICAFFVPIIGKSKKEA